MSNIISLQAENVKRLKAVHIKPTDKGIVVVGGKNGQGKTSVLDSIMYALGGKPACKKPVHEGEKKGTVTVELEDLIVQRIFTEGGSRLEVTAKQGEYRTAVKSPQAILDKLVGQLSFDPGKFSNMSDREQAETLKGLVGIDFDELDSKRKEMYDERTMVNRELKTLQIQHDAIEAEPVEPVQVSELMAELKRRQEVNRKNNEKREQVEFEQGNIEMADRNVSDLQEKIERLQESLKDALALKKTYEECLATAKDEAAGLQDEDTDEIEELITHAQEANNKAAEYSRKQELAEQLKAKESEAESLNGKIQDIDTEKQATLEKAKFPIDGLLFDGDGVTFNGTPFAECSSAERLRVSVAMGLAMNPKLKVILIRDGSLLDDDSMKMVAEMAEEAGAQIWIERVGTDGHTSVVIEDGAIKGEG